MSHAWPVNAGDRSRALSVTQPLDECVQCHTQGFRRRGGLVVCAQRCGTGGGGGAGLGKCAPVTPSQGGEDGRSEGKASGDNLLSFGLWSSVLPPS